MPGPTATPSDPPVAGATGPSDPPTVGATGASDPPVTGATGPSQPGASGPDGTPGSASGAASGLITGSRTGGSGGWSELLGESYAAMTADLPAFGSQRWIRLAAQGVAVSTSVTMAALALFGLRRRRGGDDESRDEGNADPRDATALKGEAGMPRWRRPSLIAARKAAPIADPARLEAERLRFTDAEPASTERRRIRYRMVRLSDGPDEVFSVEIGRLDQGDEVELLERSGSFWRVRIPTGQEGWVHRMTLASPTGAADATVPGDEQALEIDVDVLAAFTASRRRSLARAEPWPEPRSAERGAGA